MTAQNKDGSHNVTPTPDIAALQSSFNELAAKNEQLLRENEALKRQLHDIKKPSSVIQALKALFGISSATTPTAKTPQAHVTSAEPQKPRPVQKNTPIFEIFSEFTLDNTWGIRGDDLYGKTIHSNTSCLAKEKPKTYDLQLKDLIGFLKDGGNTTHMAVDKYRRTELMAVLDVFSSHNQKFLYDKFFKLELEAMREATTLLIDKSKPNNDVIDIVGRKEIMALAAARMRRGYIIKDGPYSSLTTADHETAYHVDLALIERYLQNGARIDNAHKDKAGNSTLVYFIDTRKSEDACKAIHLYHKYGGRMARPVNSGPSELINIFVNKNQKDSIANIKNPENEEDHLAILRVYHEYGGRASPRAYYDNKSNYYGKTEAALVLQYCGIEGLEFYVKNMGGVLNSEQELMLVKKADLARYQTLLNAQQGISRLPVPEAD